MFSKEESKRIRQEFWTSFGKEYPRKWILYNTKIGEVQMKFTFNRKYAIVSIDVIDDDELIRDYYFEKLVSLKKILKSEYLPEVEYNNEYELPEGKIVGRAFVKLGNVSIHNKSDWPMVKEFLARNMALLEDFFRDFSEFIRN